MNEPLVFTAIFVENICSYQYGPISFVLAVALIPFYGVGLGLSWYLIERRIIPVIAPDFSLWAIHHNSPDVLEADEGLYLEFKSSFNTPLGGFPEPEIIDDQQTFVVGKQRFKNKSEVSKFIQTQSLKTIVGFLNSNGGRLVIGLQENKRKKEILS